MKRKTVFLLTFFVAILFAIVLMPNKAMAITRPLTEIKYTTSEEIKVGNAIPSSASVSLNPAEAALKSSVNLKWFKSDTGTENPYSISCDDNKIATGTFEAGKYYFYTQTESLWDIMYYYKSDTTKTYINDMEYGTYTWIKMPDLLDTININITEPTLNGSAGASTPAQSNIEFLDSSSNAITSGITFSNQMHWSCMTANGGFFTPTAADTFNEKYVYRLYINLTINSNLIIVPYENEKYTGNIKINGKTPTIKIYNYGAEEDNVQLVLLYDFRENKNAEFSYYPIIGTKLSENKLKLGDVEVPTRQLYSI